MLQQRSEHSSPSRQTAGLKMTFNLGVPHQPGSILFGHVPSPGMIIHKTNSTAAAAAALQTVFSSQLH